MAWDLNTPGVVTVAEPADISYTHITLNALLMKFELDVDGIVAKIIWRKGILDAGEFVPKSQHETDVPTGPFTNWLTQTDTGAQKNFKKLEQAMFDYLVSKGEITSGTVVELP